MAINPATEVNPFAISFQFNSDRLFMESDNIPTAVANNVRETLILVSPVIDLPSVNLVKTSTAATSSANITVIPTKPVVSSSISNVPKATNDAANIPIADAIFNRVLACRLLCHTSNGFLIASNASAKVSAIPLILFAASFTGSANLSNTPFTLFTKAPNNPIFIAPNIVSRFIEPIALPIPFSMEPRPSPIRLPASPIKLNTPEISNEDSLSKTLPIEFITPLKIESNPENAERIPDAILSNIPLLEAASPNDDTNLPTDAVTDRTALPIVRNKLPIGDNAFIAANTASFTKPNTENTPLNVSFIFDAVESFTFNFSVNDLNLFESSTSFLPVIEGNTSFQAEPIDFITVPSPWNTLVSPCITASLPPF